MGKGCSQGVQSRRAWNPCAQEHGCTFTVRHRSLQAVADTQQTETFLAIRFLLVFSLGTSLAEHRHLHVLACSTNRVRVYCRCSTSQLSTMMLSACRGAQSTKRSLHSAPVDMPPS